MKMSNHCEKKEIEIPLEKLAWDERREHGQIRKSSENVLVQKPKDVNNK